MSGLRAIVYVSSAVHLPTPAELERLLLRARQRNLDAQVTGLLNEPAAAREFTHWAMAFSAATADAFLGLSNAPWRSGDLRDRASTTPGRELLRHVWHLPARGGL